jgi:hypothetical protein
MHSSIQDELAILMERLERVVQKIHHSATTERPRCAPAFVTADSVSVLPGTSVVYSTFVPF